MVNTAGSFCRCPCFVQCLCFSLCSRSAVVSEYTRMTWHCLRFWMLSALPNWTAPPGKKMNIPDSHCCLPPEQSSLQSFWKQSRINDTRHFLSFSQKLSTDKEGWKTCLCTWISPPPFSPKPSCMYRQAIGYNIFLDGSPLQYCFLSVTVDETVSRRHSLQGRGGGVHNSGGYSRCLCNVPKLAVEYKIFVKGPQVCPWISYLSRFSEQSRRMSLTDKP